MAVESLKIDFSNQQEKTLIISRLRGLVGKWILTLKEDKSRRTTRQNGYYFAAFVPAFQEFLRDQGEDGSKETTHELLKLECNPKMIVSPVTGEMKTVGGSTKNMNTQEFNQYLDRVAAFLAKFCGIAIPEPDIYREKDVAGVKHAA